MIESVSLPEFMFPYLRATRRALESPFDIAVLHIPGLNDEEAQSLFHEDFTWVAHQLGSRMASMEALAKIMRRAGAQEVCFCFKVSDGLLTVIDWDTELESMARDSG